MGLGRWAGTLAALTLGGGGWLAFGHPGTPSALVEAAQPSTPLELEIVGGFAIVQADRRLDIAYLNNPEIMLSETRLLKTSPKESDRLVCNVPQVGTQLEVVRGNIISATPPNAPELPSKIFNLDQKEVTFQAMETGPGPGGTPPVHTWPLPPPLPTPPSSASQWQALSNIPGLTKRFPGGLDPNWFTKRNSLKHKIVNGRIRLRGGSITGAVPSRPQMQQTLFDLKYKPGTPPPFKAAVTDRAVYSASVVGNTVVILFSNDGSTLRMLEVAPLVAGEPVKLRVRGHHNGMGPAPGGKLEDFCAFYALFNDIPDYETWLELFLQPGGVVGSGGGGAAPQPTPGFYCPMDWF